MTVRIKRGDVGKPIELRAFLRPPHLGAITETWSYIVPPEPADKP
jgi:glucan biosynthesis protein